MSQRDQIVQIALSQKGYKEGPNNDTKYGEWYGLNYNPWCAMFVSWCANQAGISEDIIPKFAGCTTGFRIMTDMKITTKEHIVPQKGDLIFFDWDCSGDYDHVGIVTDANSTSVYTVEGNHNDMVDTFVYPITASYIAGYARPNYDDAPAPTPTPLPDYKDYVYNYQVAWNKTYGGKYTLPSGRTYLEEDGIYGPDTNWSTTKVYLCKGMSNPLVEWCQDRLRNHKGYSIGIDGIFGNETKNVVIQFQIDNRPYNPQLAVDGIIGRDTVSILF